MLDLILLVLACYALVGILVSVPLVAFGIQRIDPVMRSSPLSARLLMFPGSVALWPIMLIKWFAARSVSP
ncbi:MAG: hypothetical protein KC996_05600 [Phycisphaerales bacterium]|nr:hypothetical protein [Phycisphaerales bacterium]